MTNASLWYKTAANDTLAGVGATKKITFNGNSKVLHDFAWNWDNALKQTTNTNPDGTRRITLTDNGLKAFIVPLTGYILKTETQAADNLFDFLAIQQVTDNLPFGRFSITNPNLTKIDVLAGTSKGMGIGPGSFIKGDTKGKSYEFTFNMMFGGTF